METSLSEVQIRDLAKALDDAIEKHNVQEIVSYFSEECEIHFPGVTLTGREGLRKAIRWMFRYLKEIILVPVTIMIQDNIFFEEFIVKAKVAGRDIQLRQSEVLEYNTDYRVKSIRLYFDRLELAEAFTSNTIERIMIKQLIKVSLKGLRYQ